MKQRLDKVFSKAKPKHKVYQPHRHKKVKNSWWQALYSIFF